MKMGRPQERRIKEEEGRRAERRGRERQKGEKKDALTLQILVKYLLNK